MYGKIGARDNDRQLICHNCGYRLPRGDMTSTILIQCCDNKRIHIHDVSKPCDFCRPLARDK